MTMHKPLMAFVGLIALGAASPGPQIQALDEAYAIVDFQSARSGREIARTLERHLASPDVAVVARNQPLAQISRTPGRFTPGRSDRARRFRPARSHDPRARPAGCGRFGRRSADGASWRADIAPRRPGRVEQRYTLCLFPYRDGRRQGHHLDLYATTLLPRRPGRCRPARDGADAGRLHARRGASGRTPDPRSGRLDRATAGEPRPPLHPGRRRPVRPDRLIPAKRNRAPGQKPRARQSCAFSAPIRT